MLNQKEFLKKYNITERQYRKTRLKWGELAKIYQNYVQVRPSLEAPASFIAECLRRVPDVHSVKLRLKDPEHLVGKIIRLRAEDRRLEIDAGNYRDVISDLIGIRVLHLFKEDWMAIHDYISGTWELKGKPIANIREGDSEALVKLFRERGCQIRGHPFGYRSIHYIISSSPVKEQLIAEIQVRTIFEEGWSEIDHRIRYPYETDNVIIRQFLVMFNRLAGSADEMGSFIRFLKAQLEAKQHEFEKAVQDKSRLLIELRAKLDQMRIEKREKASIRTSLDILDEINFQPLPLKLMNDFHGIELPGIGLLHSYGKAYTFEPTLPKIVIPPGSLLGSERGDEKESREETHGGGPLKKGKEKSGDGSKE